MGQIRKLLTDFIQIYLQNSHHMSGNELVNTLKQINLAILKPNITEKLKKQLTADENNAELSYDEKTAQQIHQLANSISIRL